MYLMIDPCGGVVSLNSTEMDLSFQRDCTSQGFMCASLRLRVVCENVCVCVHV